MRFADLDAVTVDGFGTLVRLADPVPPLASALEKRGAVLSPAAVREAFAAEVAFYKLRAHDGRDGPSLAALRLECTRIFLAAAGAALDPASFVDAFMAAIVVRPVPGALETVAGLRARGLKLAVVSNWDIGLADQLAEIHADRSFDAVVTSAEAGVPKPDPAVFRIALDRIGASPDRALHVGDAPEDEQGARAAGMRFRPAPLATAFEGWS